MSKKKSVLTKKSISFLEKYLNNASPTGYESEGQKIWMNYLKPYVDTFITDSYGTAVGIINPEAKFKVVIEGHADEISWYVNYITPEGLIYVIRNGGSDHIIAPSKIVNMSGIFLAGISIGSNSLLFSKGTFFSASLNESVATLIRPSSVPLRKTEASSGLIIEGEAQNATLLKL